MAGRRKLLFIAALCAGLKYVQPCLKKRGNGEAVQAFTVRGVELDEGLEVSHSREGQPFRQSVFIGSRPSEEGDRDYLIRVDIDRDIPKVDVLFEASIKRVTSGRVFLAPPRGDDDQDAIVLVRIAPGFGGETRWSAGDSERVPCPHRGKRFPYAGSCPRCGTAFSRLHPDEGEIPQYADFPPPGVEVVSEASRLWHDNRTDSDSAYAVRLIRMEPGTTVRVERTGKLGESVPGEVVLHWDGSRLRVGSAQELCPRGTCPNGYVPRAEVEELPASEELAEVS